VRTGPGFQQVEKLISVRDFQVIIYHAVILFLLEKAAETPKQKEEKRENPKPEEHDGMPQHQHRPHAKRRGDRNPKYHEAKHKDVA
jgi:hypothetical protein